jgi:hypothetical protein
VKKGEQLIGLDIGNPKLRLVIDPPCQLIDTLDHWKRSGGEGEDVSLGVPRVRYACDETQAFQPVEQAKERRRLDIEGSGEAA